MTQQFAMSGVPLFKTSGTPAMDSDCCCDPPPCPDPCCGLTLRTAGQTVGPTLPPVTVAAGYYRIDWSAANLCHGALGGPVIISIEVYSTTDGIDDVSTFYDPPVPPAESTSGYFTVPIGTEATHWTVKVINDCGGEAVCTLEVPCCWQTTTAALESTGFSAEYSRECQYYFGADPIDDPEDLYEDLFIVRGLDGLNGTLILTPPAVTGLSSGFCNLCHYTDPLIPLGISGEVEYRTWDTLLTGAVDACGNPWVDKPTKTYNKYTGDFYVSCIAGVQTIVFIPTLREFIVARPLNVSGCYTDPRGACSIGTIWDEDNDYCLRTSSTSLPIFYVAEIDYASYYGYSCSGPTSCQITSLCYMRIISRYSVSPHTTLLEATFCNLAPSGTTTTPTCSLPNCVLGYAQQKLLYNV